jgi:hypothetical protein
MATTDGLFKFAGRVVVTNLSRGSTQTGCLADDPFLGVATAQAIAIFYPIVVPIEVHALGTYLNSTVPQGITVTFFILKNNLATPIQIAYAGGSSGGVQTSLFTPPVAFAAGDRLDLAVEVRNGADQRITLEAPCSATVGYRFAP